MKSEENAVLAHETNEHAFSALLTAFHFGNHSEYKNYHKLSFELHSTNTSLSTLEKPIVMDSR